jgi:hypothetical protein
MKSESKLTIYRSCTPVVDTWAKADTSITEAIINALAEVEGASPTELTPLYKAVDPDVFTKLFEGHNSETDADTLLSFTYGTWNIFVRADGKIRVCDGTRPTEPTPVFEGNPV